MKAFSKFEIAKHPAGVLVLHIPWFCWWQICTGHSGRERACTFSSCHLGRIQKGAFISHSIIPHMVCLKWNVVKAKYEINTSSCMKGAHPRKSVNKLVKCKPGFHNTVHSLCSHWKYLGLPAKLLNTQLLGGREKVGHVHVLIITLSFFSNDSVLNPSDKCIIINHSSS